MENWKTWDVIMDVKKDWCRSSGVGMAKSQEWDSKVTINIGQDYVDQLLNKSLKELVTCDLRKWRIQMASNLDKGHKPSAKYLSDLKLKIST